jgi:pimeloyl-ACP methyl ester carboxylesterase
MSSIFQRQNLPHLAYHKIEGRSPGILFLHGFNSDKNGVKAQQLAAWCHNQNRAFISFDHTGHGESGGEFSKGTIGLWRQDTLDILTHLADEPVICVGSSMGGWMSVLAALDAPHKVLGIVGVAAAPDFTTELLPKHLSAEQKRSLDAEGYFLRPSMYGNPYPITRELIEESHHHLVLTAPLDCRIPLSLLHGLNDADVPWNCSLALVEKWLDPRANLNLIKGGDHRLNEPSDIGFLLNTVEKMLNEVG